MQLVSPFYFPCFCLLPILPVWLSLLLMSVHLLSFSLLPSSFKFTRPLVYECDISSCLRISIISKGFYYSNLLSLKLPYLFVSFGFSLWYWGRSTREGNGNPLQYSCLENPMDREVWWATVNEVAKSQTWLKRLSMHFGIRSILQMFGNLCSPWDC